jgi:hypothetical protein
MTTPSSPKFDATACLPGFAMPAGSANRNDVSSSRVSARSTGSKKSHPDAHHHHRGAGYGRSNCRCGDRLSRGYRHCAGRLRAGYCPVYPPGQPFLEWAAPPEASDCQVDGMPVPLFSGRLHRRPDRRGRRRDRRPHRGLPGPRRHPGSGRAALPLAGPRPTHRQAARRTPPASRPPLARLRLAPRLDAFLRDSAVEGDEPLDPNRL